MESHSTTPTKQSPAPSPQHSFKQQASTNNFASPQEELYVTQFCPQTIEWKKIQQTSTEALSQYITYTNLLSRQQNAQKSNEYMLQLISKLSQFHKTLLDSITGFSTIHRAMQDVIANAKRQIQEEVSTKLRFLSFHNSSPTSVHDKYCNRGPYNTAASPADYIQIMELRATSYEQELDTKLMIFESLFESNEAALSSNNSSQTESSLPVVSESRNFVLNTYLILWKKQPFVEEHSLSSHINTITTMHERTKMKL